MRPPKPSSPTPIRRERRYGRRRHVEATDNSAISATIVAIAATAGLGGEAGVGVAIGVSLAYNEIGDATGFGSGSVTAYITGGSVASEGLVTVAATSEGTISATTIAVAAALSGGGETGVGVAGAGVGVFNTIRRCVRLYRWRRHQFRCLRRRFRFRIRHGNDHRAHRSGRVSASFGGEAGVSVSIGLSIAANVINDPVTAYITGVT